LAQTSGALVFFLGLIDKLQFGDLFLISAIAGMYYMYGALHVLAGR
jgi:hypothetical protein